MSSNRKRTSTEDSSIFSSTQWSEQDQKNELVKMLFRLENSNEIVLRDFSCAYSGTILLHGRLYVLQRTLCFYSNIFGHETRKIVPIHKITAILKRSTLGIIPTAIEIEVAGADNVVFASFFGSSSRNECYDIISKLHMNLGPSSSERKISGSQRRNQDGPGHRRRPSGSTGSSSSGSSSGGSGGSGGNSIGQGSGDNSGSSSSEISSSKSRTRRRANSEASFASSTPSSTVGFTRRSRGASLDEELVQTSTATQSISGTRTSRTNYNASTTSNTSASYPSSVSTNVTPSTPLQGQRPTSPIPVSNPADIDKLLKREHIELCRATLPVSVQGFYNMFCSDDTREFLKMYHTKRGDSEFQCTKWKDTELGSTREISIRAPVTGAPMLAPDSTRVFKTQRKQWYGTSNDQVLVFDTSQSMSDIPYGDYFTVEERWIIRPYNDTTDKGGRQWKGCEFIASVEIKFHKYTMFKGVIVARAKKDIKEANDLWITMCTEHLQSSNDPREPIVSPLQQNPMSAEKLKRDGKTSPSIRSKRNRRSDRAGSSSSSSSSQRCGNSPVSFVVYLWGLIVLILILYMCREISSLKSQVNELISLKDERCPNQ